jgi:hypothetical protein
MSLIKLANPLTSIMGIIPSIFSARAAKSGNPLKYIMSRTNGPIRKNIIQRSALAGLAHSEANLRKGLVQDSTTFRGALVDGPLLGQFGRMGINMLEDIHNNPQAGANRLVKNILKHAISDEGQFKIKNIEGMINFGNNAHKFLGIAKRIPTAHLGTISGAAIGYSHGDNEHEKLKGMAKGGLIGGALGGSAKKMINFTHNKLSMMPKIHKEYFKDNYWKSQLEAANKPFYNKLVGKHLLANSLMSTPEARAVRIAKSDKWQERGEKFWKVMNTDIKDLSWKKRQS